MSPYELLHIVLRVNVAVLAFIGRLVVMLIRLLETLIRGVPPLAGAAGSFVVSAGSATWGLIQLFAGVLMIPIVIVLWVLAAFWWVFHIILVVFEWVFRFFDSWS